MRNRKYSTVEATRQKRHAQRLKDQEIRRRQAYDEIVNLRGNVVITSIAKRYRVCQARVRDMVRQVREDLAAEEREQRVRVRRVWCYVFEDRRIPVHRLKGSEPKGGRFEIVEMMA